MEMAAMPKNSEDLDKVFTVPKNIYPKRSTDIQRFYSKKNILITGATGFLGKLLVEKLLWSCPDIGYIYLLLRDKKGKDSGSRIDELLDTPAFVRLKKDRPLFKEKFRLITGDCSVSGLGISAADRQEIIKEVNVVFHVAATVRFHEPLTIALNINLRATQDMLDLGKEIKSLKAFIHVSTAYSQCYSSSLDERFYDTPMDPIKLLKFLETADQQIIDAISPKLLGKWPNTYTFSKAMAEDYIRQSAIGMPIGIFRPSIIISAVNEPVPRWVDNWYGVNGYVTACSAGLLRVVRMGCDKEANLVPVDMCVNGLIASAWDISERYKESKRLENGPKPTSRDIRIYNFVLTENPISWGKFYKLTCRGGVEFPPTAALWYHSLIMSTNPLQHSLYKFFLHYVPAAFFDLISVCAGKKAQTFKLYNRIHKMEDVTMFFTMHGWNFTNDNMLKVIAKMSDDDRRLYSCDVRTLDWNDYLHGYFLGIRRYLLKDEDSTLAAAKRKYIMLYWLHKLVKLVMFLAAFKGIFRSGKAICSKFNKTPFKTPMLS
ncbi:fatty acyl-CoA reductase wat-like isoform X2 [Arctopsyche grandis]|uniref:fatty acyl-CoA reductase wat-like isoform X2 n=1 Tax=Arctopsyche grandis TaxID=121162 RepID=UPI00406D9985